MAGRLFAGQLAVVIEEEQPPVVLQDGDGWSRRTAPQAAELPETGLYADCAAPKGSLNKFE